MRTIRPRSGVETPAIMRSVIDFPDPDGPSSPTDPLPALSAMRKVKFSRLRSTSTSSAPAGSRSRSEGMGGSSCSGRSRRVVPDSVRSIGRVFLCTFSRRTIASEKITIRQTQRNAVCMSPASTDEKIAIGMVCVRPGMLPASIKVAPNSPRARAKARTVPAITPGPASGNNTRRKTAHSLAPSVRAACSNVGFTCSNAPNVVRYIRGNAITVAAMTVAGHENAIERPTCSSASPMKLRLPKISRRKNPTTVGGSTKGSVRRPSIHARRPPRTSYITRAATIPKKNVATVAVHVVASEMMSGDVSIARITVQPVYIHFW